MRQAIRRFKPRKIKPTYLFLTGLDRGCGHVPLHPGCANQAKCSSAILIKTEQIRISYRHIKLT